MVQIKSYDVEAWKDLERLNPAAWTRSAFKVNTKHDLQVNNMRETLIMEETMEDEEFGNNIEYRLC